VARSQYCLPQTYLVKLFQDIKREILKRLSVYAVCTFIIWPLFSVLVASTEIRKIPYFSISFTQSIVGSTAGMIILVPDFLLVGMMIMILSLLFYSTLAAENSLQPLSYSLCLVFEMLLLLSSMYFGISLFYPAALNHPMMVFAYSLKVWLTTILLGFVIFLGSYCLASKGNKLKVILSTFLIGLIMPFLTVLGQHNDRNSSYKSPIVLLGLDSLSHYDKVDSFRDWTEKNGGDWYLRAVPPGLLTNSVWTSLITLEPVNKHRVFHVFQSFRTSPVQGVLVNQAKRLGFHTVSVFPDQLTCWIGSESGFDENLGGPIGWRQIATSYVENASIFLPLGRLLFPKIPFSSVPSNHAGTYTYSIDKELDKIFLMNSRKEQTFVAAHLTYLHIPCFPKYAELSWDEILRVLNAPVKSIKDRTLDWQDVDLQEDPIKIREWKIKRLLQALSSSIYRTKFLSPERNGRLVVFSDHGNRIGLTVDNFWEDRYHHVLLATFGLPVKNTENPISLIDVGSLLGFIAHIPFEPIVEFTLSEPSEWPKLVNTASIHWDGTVTLDEKLVGVSFRRLRSFRPWSSSK
jgi:hypothetical protein